MESREKVNFIFAAYDFSGAGELSYDESLLLFRSVAKGLSKTCPGQAEVLFGASTIQEVLDTKIDSIVTNAINGSLTLDALQAYTSSHPVTNSWLNFCTQFQGEEVAASEDAVSKVFDGSSLCQDITFAPKAYVPYTDYKGVEEVKEESPEESSKADEGSNAEGSQEVAEEESKDNEGAEEKKEEEVAVIKKKPKVKNSKITPWVAKAMLFKPEEMPAQRSDDPTDIFDLSWLYGVSAASGFKDSVVYTANHNVVYAASNYVVIASMAAAEGDGEEAEEGAAPSGTWSQKVYRQHAHPVSALAADTKKTHFASADTAAAGETSADSTKIIVWDAATNTPVSSFVTANEAGVGVRGMDFSKDGSLLLALMNDMHNTINIYDVASGVTVFTVRHGDAEMVASACFSGSSDVFVVAGSKGATFYVNEGNSFLASSGFTKYERRSGLLGSFASQFTGTSVIQTNVCRFEFADESVTGTAAGEIIFWHGRNCVQVLKAFENSDAVSRLTFNSDSGVIAASSASGRIALFRLSSGTVAPAAGVTKAGPKVPLVRQLEPVFGFDLMHLGAARPVPMSLDLHDNGERCLISTRSGDVYELSLKPQLPPGAEGAEGEEGGEAPAEPAEGEEAPAGEGEAAKQESKPTYGAVLWGGPIGTGHFAAAGNNALAVTGLCPNGAEAFISCGADGAVRSYECKEGGANKIIAESFCDSGCVTVAASPTLAAVSMDGSMVPNRLGTVQILSLPDLKFVTEFKQSEEKVSLLRFNAEGSLLLTCTLTVKPDKGAGEGKVTTTSIIRSYGLTKEEGEEVEKWALKESSPEIFGEVTSIDYSADGAYFRCSNVTTDRLQIFQATATETIVFGTEIKGEAVRALGAGFAWATNACALSWDTLGAFNTLKGDFAALIKDFNDEWEAEEKKAAATNAAAPADGEGGDEGGDAEEKSEEEVAAAEAAASASTVIDDDDVATGPGLLAKLGAVARSQHLFLSTGAGGTVTATRVPAFEALELEPEVGTTSFSAHCGRISAMAFVGEAGERLVTAGADDGLIMVWKVSYDVSEPEGEGGEEPEAPEGDEEEGAAAVDDGYETAEEEDFFDGDRLLAHLTAKRLSDKKISAVQDWVEYVGRTKEDMPATSFETMPNDELALDWVYGYAARSTRGAVKYDGEGRIIYPASTLGVVFDKAKSAEQTEKQSYFMGHSDEITALDVHMGTGIAASGNKGCGDISVYLWETASQKTLRRISCGEVRAISAIAFSPSGTHVAVACQDDAHTIKLFEVHSGNVVAEAAGGSSKVLTLTFSLAKDGPMRLLQTGVKHFRVLEYDGAMGFTVKIGRFGMKKMDIPAACALPLPVEGGNEFLLGMSNGFVAFLPRGELTLAGAQPILIGVPVTAMVCATLKEATAEEPAFFKVAVAGGRSQIKFVGSELEVLQEADLSTDDYGLVKGGNVRGFKSLAVDKAMRKLMYGTSGGEIGEIDFENCMDMNEGKPLVYAHFKDSLRAMQQHPIRQEALTAGDDKTLRVWDLETHKMMTYVALPDIASCACYAPNGQIICVGLGGTVRGDGRTNPRDFDGKVAIVSYLQGVLNIVHIAGDAQDSINDIAFSTDGARLYAASGDSNIYVYDALDNFKLTNTLKVHGDGVKSIDLSEDGKLMLTTGMDGEIITWDLVTETPTTLDTKTWEATNWSHRNGPRGYNSTGLYPSFESQNVLSTCCSSRDFKLVAAGDVYGAIKLALSPAVSLDTPHKRYVAHSPGGVAKVAFTVEDQFFVSIGEDDRCLMQWKVAKSEVEPTKKVKAPGAQAEEEGTPLGNFADSFKEMGSLAVAANPETSTPSVQPSLESMTGATHAPRAMYCGVGSIVSVVGKKLVSFAEDRLSQAFWTRPNETAEVGAIAVSTSARYVLVGTKASTDGNGALCILNASTGKYAALLSSEVAGGVNCVAFSHDGQTVACVGGDANSTLSLYTSVCGDWSDASLLWSGETIASQTTHVTFLSGSDYAFVTIAADNSFKWWQINGRNIRGDTYKTEPIRDNNDNLVEVVVTGAAGMAGKGELVTGNSEGEVTVWTGPDKFTVVGSHAPVLPSAASIASNSASGTVSTVAKPAPVGAVSVGANGTFVTGGGYELMIWGAATGEAPEFPYVAIKTIDINEAASSACSNASQFDAMSQTLRPTSVSADSSGKRLLVGLSSNAVIEVAVDNGATYVVEEGEVDCIVSGACAHPTEPATVATALSTGVVKLWDLSRERREVVGTFLTENKKPSALAFVSDNLLAVGIDRSDTGGKSGSIILLELPPLEPVTDSSIGRQRKGQYRKMKASKKIHNIGKGVIHSLKLTPDGKYLAAGSADGSIYFFDSKEYEPAGSFVAISGVPIVAFDFNSDGSYVRAFGPNEAGDYVIKSAYFMLNLGDAGSDLAIQLKEGGELAPLAAASWTSVTSPVALEAKGVHPAAIGGAAAGEIADKAKSALMPAVSTVARLPSKNLTAAAYGDGTAKIFGAPADATSSIALDYTHCSGAVYAVFLGSGALATIGVTDGNILVYNL